MGLCTYSASTWNAVHKVDLRRERGGGERGGGERGDGEKDMRPGGGGGIRRSLFETVYLSKHVSFL